MDKILLALSNEKIDTASIDFACQLCSFSFSELKGILLSHELLEQRVFIAVDLAAAGNGRQSIIAETTFHGPEETGLEKEIVASFRNAAHKNGVFGYINEDRLAGVDEMISDSRFADVLILANSVIRGVAPDLDAERMQKILQASGCPVVLPSRSGLQVNEIVFINNGTKSSLFAIRQFTYLFPGFNKHRIVVLDINSEHSSLHEKQGLKNWLLHHYASVEVVYMNHALPADIGNFMRGRKNDFVVLGPYGKGILQSIVNNQQSETTVHERAAPAIFLTHY